MNKKLLIFGLIIIIATGFYINGLLNNNDNIITTSAGTNITVPYKNMDSQNISNGEVFATTAYDQFTYVIAFNATENPELYQELCNIICQGQRYKDDDTGVVFYQEVSTELVNSYSFMGGKDLALENKYFNGGIMLNNETGECIIVVSTISSDVIDILKSIEWGDKTIKTTHNTVNTTATVEEPVSEDTTVETTNVDNTADKKTYDNADGIGLSDDDYSKQHQKEIDAYEKGLEDAGYFDEEEEPASDDASASSAN